MQASAAQWLARWQWSPEPGARTLTDAALRDLLQQAYTAGYSDCRLAAQPPKKV